MSNKSDGQHRAINESGMLVGRDQTEPMSTLQAEIAFAPSKVAFNDGLRAQMKASLVNKEQGG